MRGLPTIAVAEAAVDRPALVEAAARARARLRRTLPAPVAARSSEATWCRCPDPIVDSNGVAVCAGACGGGR